MRKKITLNEPTKTKSPEVRLIQKKQNWCPINQCECLLEKCVACEHKFGMLMLQEKLITVYAGNPDYEFWYCKHYDKEIKRVKL